MTIEMEQIVSIKNMSDPKINPMANALALPTMSHMQVSWVVWPEGQEYPSSLEVFCTCNVEFHHKFYNKDDFSDFLMEVDDPILSKFVSERAEKNTNTP